jgi:hypothetical protein
MIADGVAAMVAAGLLALWIHFPNTAQRLEPPPVNTLWAVLGSFTAARCVVRRHATWRVAARVFSPADWHHRAVVVWMLRCVFRLDQHLWHVKASNQPMKPTAPLRGNFSVFATTPCRGLSLSR